MKKVLICQIECGVSRNGEPNPLIKDDLRSLDFVNNVIYLNDVPQYADGSGVTPYGTRLFACGSGFGAISMPMGMSISKTFKPVSITSSDRRIGEILRM